MSTSQSSNPLNYILKTILVYSSQPPSIVSRPPFPSGLKGPVSIIKPSISEAQRIIMMKLQKLSVARIGQREPFPLTRQLVSYTFFSVQWLPCFTAAYTAYSFRSENAGDLGSAKPYHTVIFTERALRPEMKILMLKRKDGFAVSRLGFRETRQEVKKGVKLFTIFHQYDCRWSRCAQS